MKKMRQQFADTMLEVGKKNKNLVVVFAFILKNYLLKLINFNKNI